LIRTQLVGYATEFRLIQELFYSIFFQAAASNNNNNRIGTRAPYDFYVAKWLIVREKLALRIYVDIGVIDLMCGWTTLLVDYIVINLDGAPLEFPLSSYALFE